MTHQEFLNRVKDSLKVDVDFYTKWIEPLYMMCDLDKDQFCASFNKWGKFMIDEQNETVFEGFVNYYRASEAYEIKVREEKQELINKQVRLENLLIKNGFEHLVDIPTSQLIRRKLSMGMGLTDSQRDYILENLH